MTSREERNAKFILDEYAAAGLQPVRRSDGELVTLGLARKLGASNEGEEIKRQPAEAAE